MENDFSDLRFSVGPEKGMKGISTTEHWGLGEAPMRGWCRVKPSLASPSSLPVKGKAKLWSPSEVKA